MADMLENKRIAMLVENGFEEEELTRPMQAMEESGAHVEIVSPANGRVRAWKHTDWGEEFPVDRPLVEARAEDYDALVLPGGVMNADHLRRNQKALTFVRTFFEEHKPVAAICHAPWTLIDAGVVRGRRMTSYPSLQTDLRNAGANWVDEEVVTDQGLVTSRNLSDIPAFIRKSIEEIVEGKHERQTVPHR
jgi:protease I